MTAKVSRVSTNRKSHRLLGLKSVYIIKKNLAFFFLVIQISTVTLENCEKCYLKIYMYILLHSFKDVINNVGCTDQFYNNYCTSKVKRTRSDLHSLLGTSNSLQAYYSFMVAVLYIYIFKCMHFYKLCTWCMGCQERTLHCYIIYTPLLYTPGWVLVQEVSPHCVPCDQSSTQFVNSSDCFSSTFLFR